VVGERVIEESGGVQDTWGKRVADAKRPHGAGG
jgi:hypothetical protein